MLHKRNKSNYFKYETAENNVPIHAHALYIVLNRFSLSWKRLFLPISKALSCMAKF
jgi:hypothetical protein